MNLSSALSLGKRPHLYCDNVLEDGKTCDFQLRLGDGRNFWDDEPTMVCDECDEREARRPESEKRPWWDDSWLPGPDGEQRVPEQRPLFGDAA